MLDDWKLQGFSEIRLDDISMFMELNFGLMQDDNSLMCHLFLAGFGIHAQHRCEISWESQIIQLSGGQPLGAKNHRLWAPVI